MKSASFRQALLGEKILVADGAWGTLLQAAGLQPGTCPELWCSDRPDAVQRIAAGYVAAGSDLVETNSFGASRFKLAHYGLAERAFELNRAAATLSRQAAGDHAWVMGSVGPTGTMLLLGEATEDELRAGFEEQIAGLRDGGADAVCIETFSALDEALLAVQAARAVGDFPVICTFTFERSVRGDYRTIMGVSPADAAQALLDAGVDVLGTNCGNGLAGMIPIIAEMRRVAPRAPMLVQANAGLPTQVDGADVFPETPADMAAGIPAIITAGATMVGGCCGTTPAHIAAIRATVDRLG